MTKSIKTTPYLFIFNWMLNSCELVGFLAGILRDKTIANKFMLSLMMRNKTNTPFYKNYMLKSLDTASWKPTIKITWL